jgi:ethanolamine transporter EutH
VETELTKLGAALLAVLVPLAMAGIKRLIPKLPKFLLPILAPVVGAGLDALGGWIAGISVGSSLAAGMLGLAGVGIREIADQSKKALKAAH